jgi:small subunit ribosomal protein S18
MATRGKKLAKLKSMLSKRRRCRFCADKVTYIDYKDYDNIRRYVSDRGKIIPRRVLSTCAKHQRQLAEAVKRARFMAILPFVSE